jgi:hypothetical protein
VLSLAPWPSPFSGAGSAYPYPCPPHTFAVGVRVEFAVYVFHFCWGGVSVCPADALDYFLRERVGESHVVHDAYLFILQFNTRNFGTGWWGEMVHFFSV